MDRFPIARYRLHARTRPFARRVEAARRLIGDGLARCERPYVACSFGKDSLAMLHLVQTIRPEMPVVFHDSGVELPGSYALRDRLLVEGRLPNFETCAPRRPVWDLLRAQRERIGSDDLRDRSRMDRQALFAVIDEHVTTRGYDAVLLGLRKAESRSRRLLLSARGAIFANVARRVLTICPLADWSGDDVFAYLMTHDQPLHEAYTQLRFVDDPARARVSWWADDTLARRGRLVWLRYYYPDLFNRFAAEFPEIKQYA